VSIKNFFSVFKSRKWSEEDQVVRRAYMEGFKSGVPRKTPINEVEFVVLDTETTGLDVNKDAILSIAAIKIRNYSMNLETRFEAIFRREDYILDDGVKIHGILKRHLTNGGSEKEILADFLQFVGNAVIVGHHVGFDISLLNRSLDQHFGIQLKNKTMDTARMYYRLNQSYQATFKPRSLDKLCEEFHVPLGKRHTAAGDTFITSIVFMKCLARLEKRKVKTLGELLK
jgi:DNA polymerase-3 subunit epsilon